MSNIKYHPDSKTLREAARTILRDRNLEATDKQVDEIIMKMRPSYIYEWATEIKNRNKTMKDIVIHIEGGIIQAVYVRDDNQMMIMGDEDVPDILVIDIDDEASERVSESTPHTVPVTEGKLLAIIDDLKNNDKLI